MVAIICIMIFFAVVLLLALLNVRLSFRLLVIKTKCTLSGSVGIALGLIRIPFEIKVTPELFLKLLKPEKKKEKKKSKLPFLLLKNYKKWLRIKKLMIKGRIGIKDDAFKTVMYTGAAQLLLENAMPFVITKKSAVAIAFKPCFSWSLFWINMEGILHLSPTQIIGMIIFGMKGS